MKVVMAGQGAFGVKHIEAMANIDGVEVVSLAGGSPDTTKAVAEKFNIPHWTTNLAEALAQPGVEAAILATPTGMHAAQTIQCLEAGKHVQVEIPMADNLADAEAIVAAANKAGRVAMAGHTRRFNPSHQWIHKKIKAGELKVQQMDVQTYFFRRRNINAAGVKEREDVAKLNAGLQQELAGKGLAFNQPNVTPFRDKLRSAGFYAEWKAKFGNEAWSTLEKYTGKLG